MSLRMRPLLNAPETRLTTLQTEEKESSLYNSSFGDDPEYVESDSLLRNEVCNCNLFGPVHEIVKLFISIHIQTL